MKLTLDTGIILAFVIQEDNKNLESLDRLFELIKTKKHQAFISTITIAEIFSVFSKLGEAKKAVETMVSLRETGLETIDVNEEIAKNGGVFKSKYSTAKKGFSYADAIVLATALYTKSDAVLTYDAEFSGVSEVKVLKPEDL